MIRVQVVDDHALVREGIALILGAQPDLDVVAQYASGPELLASAVEADVVLLDLYLPGMDGLEVLRRLGPAVTAGADADHGRPAPRDPRGPAARARPGSC